MLTVMPRKMYTKTSTGIVIGSAYIQKASVSIDEDTQRIQNSLLAEPKESISWGTVVYILLVVFALFLVWFISHNTPAHF